MPSRMSRTFSPPAVEVPRPTAVNHERFPAYKPDLRESIAEYLMLGTFGNAFYASSLELAAQATDVLREGVVKEPRFVAQAAVLAREEGYIRSAPILALGLLAAGDAVAQRHAKAIFGRIVRTGDDLRNFVALVQSGVTGRKFGGLRQRLVRDWLRVRLNEYAAIKYAGAGEKTALRNVLRLAHPKADEPWRNEVYAWLVKGEIGEGVPQIAALRDLASGDRPAAEAIAAGLPFEAVMPRVKEGDRATWAALLPKAPYMMLLRSLNAFGRAGVWEDEAALADACQRIADPEAVRRSMQFPFRFMQAAMVLRREGAPQQLISAVYRAAEVSLGNMPALAEGTRLAIAPDVSGSMHGAAVSKDVTAAGVAGLFAAALWKANPRALVLPFGTQVCPVRLTVESSVLDIAEHIGGLSGGGTDLGRPVEELRQHGRKVDIFVGLTDSEDWAGHGFLRVWEGYRKAVAPEARAVLVQLVPNQAHAAPTEFPGVRYVYGWSDSVLRYVADVAAGRSMLQRVEAVEV